MHLLLEVAIHNQAICHRKSFFTSIHLGSKLANFSLNFSSSWAVASHAKAEHEIAAQFPVQLQALLNLAF